MKKKFFLIVIITNSFYLSSCINTQEREEKFLLVKNIIQVYPSYNKTYDTVHTVMKPFKNKTFKGIDLYLFKWDQDILYPKTVIYIKNEKWEYAFPFYDEKVFLSLKQTYKDSTCEYSKQYHNLLKTSLTFEEHLSFVAKELNLISEVDGCKILTSYVLDSLLEMKLVDDTFKTNIERSLILDNKCKEKISKYLSSSDKADRLYSPYAGKGSIWKIKIDTSDTKLPIKAEFVFPDCYYFFNM